MSPMRCATSTRRSSAPAGSPGCPTLSPCGSPSRSAPNASAPRSRVPHQILCIGLNYSDHAAETGQAVPTEPILFTKSPNTLVGPNDDVRLPRGYSKTDWEVELGIVIGTRTSYLDSADGGRLPRSPATPSSTTSASAPSRWSAAASGRKGKSAETFNPCGPWLVTPDEVRDVNALGLWLDVNGVRRQTGSTATMIFDPFTIVHYLSQFMVLEPGDLINTGTPPGVGHGLQAADLAAARRRDGTGRRRAGAAAPGRRRPAVSRKR